MTEGMSLTERIENLKNFNHYEGKPKKLKSSDENIQLDFEEFKRVDLTHETSKLNSIDTSEIIAKNSDTKKRKLGKNEYIDLRQFALRSKDIENLEFKFLIDDFIDENSVNFITSEANKGKTFLTFAICKLLLESERIKEVIYFDGDNGKQIISNRLKKYIKIKDKYILEYPLFQIIDTTDSIEINSDIISDEKDINFNFIVNNFLNTEANNLQGAFIVFDSLFNFFNGDMNDNRKIADFMRVIKKISRKYKATFLFIHHKGKSAESEYMGGVNFLNATDNLFMVQTSNNDGLTLEMELKTKKARNFLPCNLKVEIDLGTLELKVEKLINENDTNILLKAKEFIEQKGEILQVELLELLGKNKGDSYAIKKLESGKGLYFDIIEKSRATGGRPLKYYVPLKENKIIINGIEIEAEQTLFNE